MNARKNYIKRNKGLNAEYSEFRDHYQQLSMFVLSHRGRFLDQSRKIKRNTKQINNRARMASRTLQGGLMAGISSPSTPWFKLQTPDSALMDFKPVKQWLNIVETLMREIFNKSNIYNSLHSLYGEIGTFGICPMGIYKDFDNVIHTQVYTVGSYRVASNEKGIIDTFYREYSYTVGQMVKKWGLDRLSPTVNNMWKNGSTELKRKILHVIEPNDDRDHMSPASVNMPIRSVYIELEDSDMEDVRIKTGFNDFPIVCPRWEVVGEETYGTSCPAMDCLGDTKALQLGEKRSAQAIDFQVKPVMQAPSTFSKYEGSGGLFPGDIIIGDDPTGKGMRNVHDANSYKLDNHEAKLRQLEDRISNAFYEKLFLAITNDTRSNVTAREIVERHEEKLLMLGPVLTRLHNELLDPVIDRTFNIMQEAGILPKPPDELVDTELSVDYISVLAQAQKLSQLKDINQFTGFVGSLSEVYPEAKHKLNVMTVIDKVSNALSIDPDIIRSDDEVTKLVNDENKQRAMMQMAEQAPGLANAAKDVSEIDPQSAMMQNMAGQQ